MNELMRMPLKQTIRSVPNGARPSWHRRPAGLLMALTLAVWCLAAPIGAQQPPQEPPKQQDEFVPVSELPAQDQLPAAPLLVTAYAFVWIVLFGYVISVGRRLSGVQREVERLDSAIKRGPRG
jgi:CcmD family protein